MESASTSILDLPDFITVVLENTPESPLDNKIKPVNLKGNRWKLTGMTDGEAEIPVFLSSDVNS